MDTESENEGMSTGKKVVAGAAVGVAVPAAVGVAKKLLGSGDDGQDEGSSQAERSGKSGRKSASSVGNRSSQAGRRTSSSSKRTRSGGANTGRSTSRARSGGSSSSGSNRTKEQLYNQAKRLKIEGRSTMTKAQLERAISRARS
jgi:hypothetical protein